MALLHPLVHQIIHHAAHQHLRDLRERDEHGELAGHLESGRFQRVVGVHAGVNQVVHSHEPAAARHHVFVRVPGVEQHGDVVVPVQEDQLLLTQDDEQGVTCKRQTEKDKRCEFSSQTENGAELPGALFSFLFQFKILVLDLRHSSKNIHTFHMLNVN